MNAGPDVERSIAQWLVEESPGRAPDRILANAGFTIDRTKQRRFAVAWREPVTMSMRGFALAAALVIVAVVGAGFVGRSTASVGGQPSPTPAATAAAPTDHVPTVAEYKAARDPICEAAVPRRQAFDRRIGEGLYDAATTPADRATKIAALVDEISFERDLYQQLLAIPVPPEMVVDRAEVVAATDGAFAIIQQEIQLLRDGKLAEAAAVDQTTAPLSATAEAFETKYHLTPCP